MVSKPPKKAARYTMIPPTDAEATVQAGHAVVLEDLGQAVTQAGELAGVLVASLADVSGQAGTREVQRVHEQQRRGTGGTTGRQVAGEEAPEADLLTRAHEQLLVLVLEREVQGLGREVPDHVGHVAAPQGHDALLGDHAREAVDDAGVLLLLGDVGVAVLHLQQQLHALDRGHHRLGDAARNATGSQVLDEGHGAAALLAVTAHVD